MPTTLTRLLDVAEATRPRKARALISRAAGGKPQVRNIMRTKRMWTEIYTGARSTTAIDTWVDQLETWKNEGTELANTHPLLGAPAINCFIWDIEEIYYYGQKATRSFQVTFIES